MIVVDVVDAATTNAELQGAEPLRQTERYSCWRRIEADTERFEDRNTKKDRCR